MVSAALALHVAAAACGVLAILAAVDDRGLRVFAELMGLGAALKVLAELLDERPSGALRASLWLAAAIAIVTASRIRAARRDRDATAAAGQV